MVELLPSAAIMGLNLHQPEFENRLKGLIFQVQFYEDLRNRNAALKHCADFLNEQNDEIRLLKLLEWFKEKFFTWMDTPVCPGCSKPTHSVGNGVVSAEERANSAERVETFGCISCFPEDRGRVVTRFPRYNNPVKLLETRTGRCGEWANCFGLLCRALGFEVRHVSDWTDHVWVEIFSLKMDRWVHCDPCENITDKPLLYEAGWSKKLNYVIAISHDDINDITWRYSHSNNHKEVLSRRRLVSESWLVNTIIKLRKQMQSKLVPARKQVLERRLIKELVEFLSPTKLTNESDLGGRISGSLEWRQARQEVGKGKKNELFEWQISDFLNEHLVFELSYNCVRDYYSCSRKLNLQGWKNGLHNCSNIFRKEERDWKTVYLAREENSSHGTLSWKFVNHSSSLKIDSVDVVLETTTFHPSALVSLEIRTSSGARINIPQSYCNEGKWKWSSTKEDKLSSCTGFLLSCHLRGGDGPVAWQHVQLFRQSMSTANQEVDVDPFQVTVVMSSLEKEDSDVN